MLLRPWAVGSVGASTETGSRQIGQPMVEKGSGGERSVESVFEVKQVRRTQKRSPPSR